MAETRWLHYHHSVRSKVLCNIRERALMRPGDRLCVAVSGGADSVALLRVLLELQSELGIVLAAAHFNHQLRGEDSEADEAFVANLAHGLGLTFFSGRADVRRYAGVCKQSIEAAGRELRYQWLTRVATEQRFDSVATAHTLDDQAETVLQKFLRGAGTRGLAGIYPELVAIGQRNARIVRPLLCVTRNEVEHYLAALGQDWREDESNLDRHFARNRLRHDLLPLLEREYNPSVRQVLSQMAEVARAEEEYWQDLAERYMEGRVQPQQFSLEGFRDVSSALQRRLLRRFVEREGIALDFEHAESLLRCALGQPAKIMLPGGWMAVHRGEWLLLRAPGCEPARADYQYALPIPGEICITEIGVTVRVTTVSENFAAQSNETDNLLSADLLSRGLTIRNWRPGDRFWPLHTGSEEKLKRLFADKHIPTEERARWPVALYGEQMVWVRGLPVARAFAWRGTGDALRIETSESG